MIQKSIGGMFNRTNFDSKGKIALVLKKHADRNYEDYNLQVTEAIAAVEKSVKDLTDLLQALPYKSVKEPEPIACGHEDCVLRHEYNSRINNMSKWNENPDVIELKNKMRALIAETTPPLPPSPPDLHLKCGNSGREIIVAHHPTKPYFAQSYDYNVHLVRTETGKVFKTLVHNGPWERDGSRHRDICNCLAFSPDGNYLLVGIYGRILVFELQSSRLIKILTGHDSWVEMIRFNPAGTCFVSREKGNTAFLWDVGILRGNYDPNDVRFEHSKSTIFAEGLSFARCGRDWSRVARYQPYDEKWTCDDNFPRFIKYLVTGESIDDMTGWADSVIATEESLFVATSPNDKYRAEGTCDGPIHVYNRERTNLLKVFKGHGSAVMSVTFSTDGKYLISSGKYDGQVCIWNMSAVAAAENI